MSHNFGECKECGCLTTRLFAVTNLATGEQSMRVACRAYPSKHWRPATERDIDLDKQGHSSLEPESKG